MASVIKKVVTKAIGGDLEALARDTLGEFCRRSRQGGVVPLKIGFSRGFLVSDPAVVRRVLLDNIANYDKRTPSFEAVRIVLGNGMLTSDGAFWKRQRRIAQPAFHGESVKRFGPIISRMAAKDEETGESMSDPQLRDEVMTMMIAGHETTANALSWLWVLLDRHPEEQDRLRSELMAVTGGGPPTVDDVAKLPRLKAVILETLRLYPPVWMFSRRALGPDDLGGMAVAKGDLVIFCPYAIHRLPELWRAPEAFRPERFEPGSEEQRNKFAYLPFSAGPRSCLGNSFAIIESQIIVGTLLSRFRIHLADPAPVEPEPRVTLRTSRPVILRLDHAPLA